MSFRFQNLRLHSGTKYEDNFDREDCYGSANLISRVLAQDQSHFNLDLEPILNGDHESSQNLEYKVGIPQYRVKDTCKENIPPTTPPSP